MKRNIRFMLLTASLIFITSNGWAYNKVGSTAGQFLKIGTGARALGMGGAYAAIADDSYALYWNVAGIAQVKSFSASLAYTNWIADLKHTFGGIIIPADNLGNFGLSVTALTGDKIEQTTIENPHGTGMFVEAYDVAFGLSYARSMTDFVSVGLTVKYIQQRLWDMTAGTVGLDVGFLLDTGYKGIKLGMTLSNFGPEMRLTGDNVIRSFDKWQENNADPNVPVNLTTAGWPLPTSYRVSIAMSMFGADESSLFGPSEDHQIILAMDALHPSDNPEHFAVGAEYGFKDLFFIRGGYLIGTDEQGPTLGTGIKAPLGGDINLILDYAYSDFGIFEYIQQFSVGFEF